MQSRIVNPNSYFFVRLLFLRLLALCYFFAFTSLSVQVIPLFGNNGISPIQDYLHYIGRLKSDIFLNFPTLFWFYFDDLTLVTLAIVGICGSLIALLSYGGLIVWLLLWLIYLSFVVVGQEFLSFQWDHLLLEAGFLAILFSPVSVRRGVLFTSTPPLAILILYRLLLFRLMFFSGAVKLLSGDEAWWSLSALNFHYETQPLPTWIGYYVHQLPASIQTFSVIVMFIIELVLPFFVFGPRRLRITTGIIFILFQMLIFLTGNYTYFNVLTITLSILLFDDQALQLLRRRSHKLPETDNLTFTLTKIFSRDLLRSLPALTILYLNVAVLVQMIIPHQHLPSPVKTSMAFFRPFRVVNSYGLFAVMTTTRPEIIIEGSNDGKTWLPYEFRYKPGDLGRRPVFVAPHQPRIDWQMWFAALSSYQRNPWFLRFIEKILIGENAVLKLLDKNPFPDSPPRYVRAELYIYNFSTLEEKRIGGNWWKRKYIGAYTQPMEKTITESSDLQH